MKAFAFRLVPPRATFMTDMNDDERATMTEHVRYWNSLTEQGTALAFGPVVDGYGLGIVLAEDAGHAERIREADPAVRSRHGFRMEITQFVQLVTAGVTYS